MKRKYSIIIIPPEHNQIPRQFNFSHKLKRILIFGSVIVVIFLASLFIHNRYQAHYINEYRQKMAYIHKLESEIQAKNLEIARINEETEEINNQLSAIAALEKKIADILKIKPQNHDSTESAKTNNKEQ